jgi:hypothetical protein
MSLKIKHTFWQQLLSFSITGGFGTIGQLCRGINQKLLNLYEIASGSILTKMQPFLQHFLLRALKNFKAQEATGSFKN